MADLQPDPVKENQLLEQAIGKKWNKFIWSGLRWVAIGLVIIVIGLLLNMGPYSIEGLLVGLGIIVVTVGVIRLLIGIINPLSPEDLHESRPPSAESVLESEKE